MQSKVFDKSVNKIPTKSKIFGHFSTKIKKQCCASILWEIHIAILRMKDGNVRLFDLICIVHRFSKHLPEC